MNPMEWLRKRLEEDDADLVREMLGSFVQQLMDAEVDARCGAPVDQLRQEIRVISRRRSFYLRRGVLLQGTNYASRHGTTKLDSTVQ